MVTGGVQQLLRLIVVASALFGLPFAALGQDAQPQDWQSDGTFTGIAFLTSDFAWSEQIKPYDQDIAVSGKGAFGVGERGVLALVFRNPAAISALVRINCQITATMPDGTEQELDPTICYYGPGGPAGVLYASPLTIAFAVGPDDPVGLARFDIVVRDLHSDREVTLTVSYHHGGST